MSSTDFTLSISYLNNFPLRENIVCDTSCKVCINIRIMDKIIVKLRQGSGKDRQVMAKSESPYSRGG